MREIVVGILMILLMIAIMAGLVPFYYSRLRDLNPDYFKKIKLKKFSKLFIGYGGKSTIYGDVKQYGVIFPIFVLHIIGYTLSVLSFILSFVLYFIFDLNIVTIEIIILAILLAEVIIVLLTDFYCSIKSKRKGEN